MQQKYNICNQVVSTQCRLLFYLYIGSNYVICKLWACACQRCKYTICRTTIHPILINSLLDLLQTYIQEYTCILAVTGGKYTISMKIEFNVVKYAPSHYQCRSRSLAPLCACAISYRPWNTAHFGLANILPRQQKLAFKIKTREERFACLEGYSPIVLAFGEQLAKP